MRIIKNINPEYSLMKQELNKDFQRTTVKLDYQKGGGYLQPEVSPYLTRYVVLRNGRLNKCTNVLAQDTVLQNYVFTPTNEDTDTTILENFWDKYNKNQLKLAVQERYQYGWGCLEILINQETGKPERLAQFPSQTAVIRKTTGPNGEELYYAIQRGIQGADKKLRLFQLLDTYPPEDEELPICLWLGGGSTHDWYDVPVWYPDADKILAKINLDMLNGEQINEGNNMDGILTFMGPPQRPDPDTGLTPEEVLKQQIRNAGTGTLTLYLETVNKELPLDVNYIKLSNDNWDYLEKFSENCEKALMSDFSIPKIRLLIDDETESMNSHKSDSLWEIYTISLNYEQVNNEMLIQEFNEVFFDIDATVEMETPLFTDKRQNELNNIILLFNTGLITLGQAIKGLEPLLPDVDFSNIDTDGVIMDERLYNGNPLGIASNDTDSFQQIMNYLQGV